VPSASWARQTIRRIVTAGLLAAAMTGPVAADRACPASLAVSEQPGKPACQLVAEGTLHSSLGNGDVVYRLYRWLAAGDEAASQLYDVAPYHNTAVTLSRAGAADEAPFFAAHYWLGVAWFETPYLARNARHGEFLVVPGRYTGTGSFVDDHVFVAAGSGWSEMRNSQSEDGAAPPWVSQLMARLPPHHGLWKGIRIDYSTLTGSSPVWRDGDGNCCPSGGEIRFRLRLADPQTGFELAEAHYRE